MPASEQVAAIDRRVRLDSLRADRRVVATLDDLPKGRVELAVDAGDVSDLAKLRDDSVVDRARHGRKTVRARLERLHGHQTQVADREDRSAHVVLRAGRERDEEHDECRADRYTGGRKGGAKARARVVAKRHRGEVAEPHQSRTLPSRRCMIRPACRAIASTAASRRSRLARNSAAAAVAARMSAAQRIQEA